MTPSRLYGMAYRPEQYNEVVDMFRQYLEERMPGAPTRDASTDEPPTETTRPSRTGPAEEEPARESGHGEPSADGGADCCWEMTVGETNPSPLNDRASVEVGDQTSEIGGIGDCEI